MSRPELALFRFGIMATVVLLLAALAMSKVEAAPAAGEVDLKITSPSAILVEAGSGTVLWEKDADQRRPIASVTKIMTLALVMEALESGRISLDDVVTASEHAASMGGSQIWLEVGEQMAVSELLRAVAIESANDASVALAEHVAGTEEAFVDMMNAKAREIGANNTSFINATGLPGSTPEEDCFSTARDVAIMSRELLKYPKIHEWLTIWIGYVRDGKNMLTNTNRLIRFYEGADGLKTGYTDRSKYCLSATALRNGVRMVSVVLSAPTSDVRFSDARKLLDYGFRVCEAKVVARAGQEIAKVRVAKGVAETVPLTVDRDLSVVVRRGEEAKIEARLTVPNVVMAPVSQGQAVGKMSAFRDGVEVGAVDVVSAQDVKRASLVPLVVRSTRGIFRSIFLFRS
ncbi:MAG: D-alanyl-D-alanine carboxypeptidase [Firmicutes bacterium]|nr:D-alanyl-D-alanine carboxypeptidase [Bacillota bacterium]